MAWKVNTAKVRGRLRENGLTVSDLSIALGCARQTVEAKLRGERPFTVQEVVDTVTLLNETPLIFFTLEDANVANNTQSQ